MKIQKTQMKTMIRYQMPIFQSQLIHNQKTRRLVRMILVLRAKYNITTSSQKIIKKEMEFKKFKNYKQLIIVKLNLYKYHHLCQE